MFLLKKTKKEYYQNLDEKNALDKKKCSKTVKPLLSDSFAFREKINLTENEKTEETLNNFFSNIVKKLDVINLMQTIHLPKTLRIQFSKQF